MLLCRKNEGLLGPHSNDQYLFEDSVFAKIAVTVNMNLCTDFEGLFYCSSLNKRNIAMVMWII